ncbi:N-glycosylase/DNA lyase [Candidatus Micrarchaeota archaeon]|nr:N-glycosylase/DNA lyase [Candidatus Micrarchaeota archaeon]
MRRLLRRIRLLKGSGAGSRISARMAEFRARGMAQSGELFKELCVCLLTANYSAEGGMRMQQIIGDGFLHLPERALASKLKKAGYRFPNARAKYICAARMHRHRLKSVLAAFPPEAAREWLADNITGLGYKESSHFLRNIGIDRFAIIDFHIVDLLARHGAIKKPRSKSLSRKLYLEIERKLAPLAERASLSPGELDMYLWYIETGKILK